MIKRGLTLRCELSHLDWRVFFLQVDIYKVPATSKSLTDALDAIRGGTMIAYPMGLPDYDLVRQILEDSSEDSSESASESAETLSVSNASLWCFNKELQLDKRLADYIGKNEKTKAVVKLQKKGAGAPQREPIVSKEEQQAMVAFYHKKQQEAELLAREDDDAALNSKWADPKSLRRNLGGGAGGGGDIQFKMGF